MSHFPRSLCFCEPVAPGGARRSASLERCCLEARLRAQMGGGPQVLVLYFSWPRSGGFPVSSRDASSVARLLVCDQRCLRPQDILGALLHGFSRVFVQLSPDIRLIRYQMDLVEAVTDSVGPNGSVALFQSEQALQSLLGAAAPIVVPGLVQEFPEPEPEAEGCVSVAEGCTLCGQCGWACPTGAIQLGEGGATLEIRDAQCDGCGMCASVCPEQALRLHPQAPVRAPVPAYAVPELRA